MTPTASQDPPIPQGEGGLMLWPWPWQGGWGGDPEPGTYIHIYIYTWFLWVWYLWRSAVRSFHSLGLWICFGICIERHLQPPIDKHDDCHAIMVEVNITENLFCPRGPITLSEDDWGVQSPPQQSISVPLPFSAGDWIPRAVENEWT